MTDKLFCILFGEKKTRKKLNFLPYESFLSEVSLSAKTGLEHFTGSRHNEDGDEANKGDDDGDDDGEDSPIDRFISVQQDWWTSLVGDGFIAIFISFMDCVEGKWCLVFKKLLVPVKSTKTDANGNEVTITHSAADTCELIREVKCVLLLLHFFPSNLLEFQFWISRNDGTVDTVHFHLYFVNIRNHLTPIFSFFNADDE